MAAGLQLIAHHLAGLLRHGVISAGENIYCGIAVFRPGVNRYVGLGEEGKTGHALGLKPMRDEVQESRTSTFRSVRDGGPEKGFVVELDRIAVVELENAVLPHHIGGCCGQSWAWMAGFGFSAPPSRVGMQVREALLHQP